MKVQSTIQPQEIYIDKIKNGRARLLVRWDITSVARVDEMTGAEQTVYEYDEAVLWWIFPDSYTNSYGDTIQIKSITELRAYINLNKEEILSFAKASKLNQEDLE